MFNQPKKILALDGGGIRGLVTIEVLAKIEKILRDHYGNEKMVLADYFDFIAGTSTGAIISAALAIGMSVDDIRRFYLDSGKDMFDRASWWNLLKSKISYLYEKDKLTKKLKDVFGENTLLGDKNIKTLLMLVTHNAETDSPWPITNNPKAKYNDRETQKAASNLDFHLWKLVRASTAAPLFFPPEHITLKNNDGTVKNNDGKAKTFTFIDGGITPYNNPAFQAYITATLGAYNINWLTGKNNLLIVSVGTGNHALNLPSLHTKTLNILQHARNVPTYLMNSSQYQQDMLCRILGDCRAGHKLDREIGTLQGQLGEGSVPEKLFTYLRYNFDISKNGLKYLGLGHLDPEQIKRLDAVEKMPELQEIGRALARQEVKPEHFAGFLPPQPR